MGGWKTTAGRRPLEDDRWKTTGGDEMNGRRGGWVCSRTMSSEVTLNSWERRQQVVLRIASGENRAIGSRLKPVFRDPIGAIP